MRALRHTAKLLDFACVLRHAIKILGEIGCPIELKLQS